MEDIDTLTQLLANTSLREELPASYTGSLSNEFEVIVALHEMACTFQAGKEFKKASVVYDSIHKVVHLINKLYFAMYGERAPRFLEQDVELALAHALHNIPTELSHDVFVVDQDTIDRTCTATSNICTETISFLEFVVSEFRQAHRDAKEQCRRATKLSLKLTTLLQKIVSMLDKENETKHKFMDTSKMKYSEMTTNERKMSARKRRQR